MPSGLAYPITDAHKSTRPSSQPTLSHAASPSNFDIEPRRSRRVRRPSAHKLESDEYEASSRGSTRPPTPSEPDPKPKSKKPAKNTRGNRPGHIVQPNADAGSTSHGSTPEPIGTPRPRPGGSFLASECATGDQPELDKAEAIRRATAFLGTDASKLPARIIQDVLYRIPHDAEDQATPMELEGGSAPAILQPAGRVVLGSRHEPSASRTTDNVGSQAPNAQPADAQLPLDTSCLGRSFNEDTVTESESELEDIELGPGDSVSQRLPPALPPPPTTTLSPRAHPTPNSHPLRHPDQITRSKAFIAAAVDDPAPESGSNSGSDRNLPAPARKRQRLAEPPRSNNLPHGSRTNPSASRPRIPSTTHRPPTSSTLARPAAPAAPTETTSTSSPASLQPPPNADLSAILIWAGQLAQQLSCPAVTTDQGASSSRSASQPEAAYDLVTKVLDKLRSGLPAPSGPHTQPQQPVKLGHNDPVEDDSEILEAEAALKLGKRPRPRRKPTLSDFPVVQGQIASLAIPELIAVACAQGAYEVFGKLSEWSGDTYNSVWARELGGLRLQKAPQALKSIMVHRISWFRGETKERVRPVIPSAYQFIHLPRTRADLLYNRKLVKKLLPNTFHCLDIDEPDEGQYEHLALRDSIASAFFWRPDAIGMVYRKKFGPVPLPAVAMILTIMQHCIKEWKSGRFVPRELNAGKQLNVYDAHLKGLLEYARSAPKRLGDFQAEWFKYDVAWAGAADEEDEPCQPITRADRVRPDTPDRDTHTERQGKRRAVG